MTNPVAARIPRTVWLLSAAVVVVLVATASRYGYHRDELYFIACAHHLAPGYADQGPLTPLIAWLMIHISAGSLTVLRIPSALMTGVVVLVTALFAREVGANARAQIIAASCSAVSVFILFNGHLLSTSTADLLVWTVASYLIVRAVRRGDDRLWFAAGATLGVGLLNKPLPAFLGVALLVGLVISGPRRLLRSPWVWGGVLVALVLSLPFVIWQAAHGWPQLTVSRAIANGGSTSSQPWFLVVPYQVLLDGPPLAVVWIAGLVQLFRDRALRDLRFVGWAWIVLAVAFMATGGKPYYLAGLLPLLTGVGAAPIERWVRWRWFVFVAALSAVIGALIALPLLPASDAGVTVAINPDIGETIGWPELVRTVARVDAAVPDRRHAVIVTANYGEAGALQHYGPTYSLPPVYSGYNAYGYWGRPHGTGAVLVVGYSLHDAQRYFTGCRVAARIHDAAGIDNDEDGGPVLVCTGPLTSWARTWPRLRHLG